MSVTQPDYTHKAAVKVVAQGYCDQFHKHAELLSTLCPETSCPVRELTFWCR